MAKKIVIIGGGASGLMAAIWAARRGASVTILERNDRPGRKLLATGNGRCNLTNLLQERQCYRGSDPDSAFRIISRFGVQETIAFFSSLGVYTRNRDGWIYPYTGQAGSVLQILLMEAAYRGVKIKTRETVTAVEAESGGGFSVRTAGWKYEADAVIVACGSPASEIEGASDTAKSLALSAGHSFLPFRPALVPLKCRGGWFSRWAGVRAAAAISLYLDGGCVQREVGELQLTGYGISGIPVFQLSRYAVQALEAGSRVSVSLDFLPDFDFEALGRYLSVRREQCPYKTLRQQMVGLLPEKLIDVLAPPDAQPDTVLSNIKAFFLEVSGPLSLGQAQVCSGGVPLGELTDSLESRRVPGLYFTGEAADVDGACGGYNLQWAWSSGTAAGLSASGGEEK